MICSEGQRATGAKNLNCDASSSRMNEQTCTKSERSNNKQSGMMEWRNRLDQDGLHALHM